MTERARGSALQVGAGAAVAALSGVVVLAIAARTLTAEQNAGFLAYWAALFAVFAVLSGIQNEVTRAVRADRDRVGRTSPLGTGLLIGVGAALVVLLLLPVWRIAFIADGDVIAPVIMIAVAALMYAGHVASVGTLAGLGRWRGFAGLTAGEAIVRLGLTAVAALLGWGVAGFELAAAGGAVTWLAAGALLSPLRRAWAVRIDLRTAGLVRRMISAMAAAAANALLVTGFPLLMSLTTDAAVYAGAAPLVVAVSMTRAPLLMPIAAFQSMVIAAFVERPARAGAALLRLTGAVVVLAAGGGLLAALAGPWAMGLVFGPGYENTPLVLGMLVVAACFLALLVLGGSIALALDAHTVNTAGWYLALIVSVGIMLTPLGLETRTILALILGPLLGATVHLCYVFAALRRRAREDER